MSYNAFAATAVDLSLNRMAMYANHRNGIKENISAFQLVDNLKAGTVSQSLILTRLEGGRTPMPEGETVASFARHGATMAIYLSAARNKALQEALLEGGYLPETPCIIGYAVTWPEEMMFRCDLAHLSETMRNHKLWKHAVVLVGPALAEGPISTRSHLYHPGFRHEYRAADAQAHADLKAHGTCGVYHRNSTNPDTKGNS